MRESATNDVNMLKEGTKIDLPLRLAVALANQNICEIRTPSYLNSKYQEVLKAGAEVVNMRNQSESIFENAMKLSLHLNEEDA